MLDLDTLLSFNTNCLSYYLLGFYEAHKYTVPTLTKPTENYSAMDAPSTPSSLFLGTQELPADVILIILKDLHEIQQISNLRVVSEQFDALVAPLSYRHVHLTDRIVAPFALKHELYDPSIVQLQVARDVSNHARSLTINRNLDWSLVAKLITSLKNLRSFT